MVFLDFSLPHRGVPCQEPNQGTVYVRISYCAVSQSATELLQFCLPYCMYICMYVYLRRTLDYQEVLDALSQKGIAIRVASPKLVMEEVSPVPLCAL